MRAVLLFFVLMMSQVFPAVKLGVDQFLEHETAVELKGKNIALVINQTSYTSHLEPTYEWLKRKAVPGT